MELTVTGRNIEITDRFREYVTEKATKVEHLADRAIALQVKASRHSEKNGTSGDDRVELTLVGPGPVVRAEAAAADKYAAFDLAEKKLIERVRRAKDRRKVHRGRHRPTSLHEAATGAFSAVSVAPVDAATLRAVTTGSVPVVAEASDSDEPSYTPVVIRRKSFPVATMSAEDAVDQMELVGHDFYLFLESETGRPSVVYRRKGWDYGVIDLHDETVAQASAS